MAEPQRDHAIVQVFGEIVDLTVEPQGSQFVARADGYDAVGFGATSDRAIQTVRELLMDRLRE